MKYIDFYNLLKNRYPVLTRNDIMRITDKQVLDIQLSDWVKKGLLVKPRKNVYLIKDNENLNPFILANRMFEPSYVSLETALFYYGFIPDVTAAVTSVTAKKSREFEFNSQLFVYQKIKANLFFGYREIRDQEWGFLIAEPEKAILDYFYLNLSRLKTADGWRELRVDNKIYQQQVSRAKLLKLLKLFNSDKLAKTIKEFDNFLRG